jgi:Plavaka transposase
LLSTDKTQLTSFRNKNAYPLYLTIGNIPKEIRRKPSLRAYVLLAYLPTTRLENVANKAQRRRMINNLYHSCMHKILEPLEIAGISGVNMSTGSGNVHRIHPIFASFIGDYPEQILSSGGITGECPSCEAPRDKLGENNIYPNRNLEAVLKILDSFEVDPAGFLRACSEAGIKPLVNPFWKNLPYANIYRSIMPDILHQLYQGIVKHMVGWVTETCGSEEVDARCRRFPPNHNLRHFNKGISSLSRVTGQEHDQMCRILMGLVLDCHLPHGFSNVRLIRVIRALLDFVFIAQYPIHTDDTLVLLEDALDRFHENKSIFVDLGIRDSFNLPKLHFAKHYVEVIKLFGTTDNYNTEYTERLHIDLAKHAFAATNYKDEFTQMTIWLERKEKVHRHEQYIRWRQDGSPLIVQKQWTAPGLELDRALSIAKLPMARSTLDSIELDYGAQYFKTALRRYIVIANHGRMAPAQLERALWDVRLPFRRLPVWHRLKFLRHDPATDVEQTADSIHAHPARKDLRGRTIPGRFDTALINDGTGRDTGLQGKFLYSNSTRN